MSLDREQRIQMRVHVWGMGGRWVELSSVDVDAPVLVCFTLLLWKSSTSFYVLTPNPVFEQCELISNFTESSFIKRGFTSGKFQGAMDGSGAKINDHIKMLGLALAEGACEHCVPVVTQSLKDYVPVKEMPPANALRKPLRAIVEASLVLFFMDACYRLRTATCTRALS
jgi:hypothetical protein